MTDQIEACPECDTSSLSVNAQTNYVGSSGAAKKYRCKGCNATFDEPNTRERQAPATLKGLAKKLHEHDEDELSSEWRYRCPGGHASITLYSSTAYCRACEQTYPKDRLRDMRQE